MIEQGYEWQVRELADAADRIAHTASGLGGAHRAAYAEGVRDALRLLVGDLDGDVSRPVPAELAAILDAADVALHEPSDVRTPSRVVRFTDGTSAPAWWDEVWHRQTRPTFAPGQRVIFREEGTGEPVTATVTYAIEPGGQYPTGGEYVIQEDGDARGTVAWWTELTALGQETGR
jgi:hypothetical protein